VPVAERKEAFAIARNWIKSGHTGVKVIGDGRIYLQAEFERMEKELKTAKELELLALEIVRRMQGCGHVKAVSVTSDSRHGWVVNGSMPGHASISDVARAIVVAQVDLRERYNLARDDEQ
jgi:CTP-dependent riboflavin kinase